MAEDRLHVGKFCEQYKVIVFLRDRPTARLCNACSNYNIPSWMGVSLTLSAHPPPSPDVAPTYAHPRRRQPPALSRPPRGLGRGRVCSIDRRRSARLAERDRAPSWRRTPRISWFACHPLFRKSSYPLLDLPSSLSPSRRLPSVLRSRVAPSSFVPHIALGDHHS